MTQTTNDNAPAGAPDDGEIYTPLMDDDGFDARQSSSRRAMFLLGGAALVLLAIAFLLLKAYGPGTRGADEPPRILADTSPYKSVPDDPGGAQTPNQDKTVYGVISGDTETQEVTLAPDAETPVTIERPAGATVQVRPSGDPVPAPAPRPAAPAPTQSAPRPAPTPSPYASSGAYVVQVAALRSQADANQEWTRLNRTVGDMIESRHYADINRTDRGERGVFYRLRVAGFTGKADANDFCAALKTRSQDCLVVRQ